MTVLDLLGRRATAEAYADLDLLVIRSGHLSTAVRRSGFKVECGSLGGGQAACGMTSFV